MKKKGYDFTKSIQMNILISMFVIFIGAKILTEIYPFLPKSHAPSEDAILQWIPHNLSLGIQNFLFLVFACCAPIFALLLADQPQQVKISYDLQFLSKLKYIFIVWVLPFLLTTILFFPFFNSDYVGILLGEFGKTAGYFPTILTWTNSFLFLFILCLAIFFFRKQNKDFNFSILKISIALLVPVFILFQFFGDSVLNYIFGGPGTLKSHTIFACIISLVASIILCILSVYAHKYSKKPYSNIKTLGIWCIFIIACLLEIFAWRIVCEHSITYDYRWYWHFEPVIYPLSQVVAGKTIGVDLPASYGLYAEILAPLFKFIGLSVLKLSVTFAVMQFLSLIAVFYVLSKLLKSQLILVLSGFSLLLITFYTTNYFVGTVDYYYFDEYYNYWPLRFFWPAISFICVYYFLIKKIFVRSVLITLVGAIGFLWNYETGLAVLLAYGGYLFAQVIIVLFKKQRPSFILNQTVWPIRNNLIAFIIQMFLPIILFFIFIGIMSLNAHGPLSWDWLFFAQLRTARFGIAAEIMSHKFSPWMIILFLYFIGLLISSTRLIWKRVKITDEILFYLSLLGIGLFIQYVSQPHPLNLISVSWPAFLITVILTDELLYALNLRVLPLQEICIPMIGFALLFLGSARFISGIPGFMQRTKQHYIARNTPIDPWFRSELDFIRENSKDKRECVILAKRAGIYYAETGLSSPIKGPDFSHLFFKNDQKNVLNQILNGDFSCVFMGRGPYSDVNDSIPMDLLLTKYKITKSSSGLSMHYLEQNVHSLR